jgi:hypothetical protein
MKIPRLMAVLVVGLALILPACASQSPVEQAVIASEVTSAGEPKTLADSFPPDVSNIYCSVKLATTSIRSTVKAEWYIVKSDEAGLTNSLIAQGTVVAGTQYVVLAFTRADRLLPKGDYEVKLYFDGKYALAVPFKVQGSSTAKGKLSEATTCTGIDLLTNKPLDKVDIFPVDISKVYCSAKIDGADFTTNIKARWTYVNGPAEALKGKVIANPSAKAEGRQYVSFSIGMPVGKQFPTGEYAVTLFIEDNEQATLPFKVVDAAAIKWPYVSELSVFSYADPDKKTAVLMGQFAGDTKEIDVRAKAYNAPPGTVLNIQWVLARSTDGVWADELIKDDKNTIDGTVEIRGSITAVKTPFVKGDYLVKLLINGQETARVPFRVQ